MNTIDKLEIITTSNSGDEMLMEFSTMFNGGFYVECISKGMAIRPNDNAKVFRFELTYVHSYLTEKKINLYGKQYLYAIVQKNDEGYEDEIEFTFSPSIKHSLEHLSLSHSARRGPKELFFCEYMKNETLLNKVYTDLETYEYN